MAQAVDNTAPRPGASTPAPSAQVRLRRRTSTLLRWLQTLLVWLLWPGVVLGILYVVVFFFLNSSMAVALVEAQLSANLRGDFKVGRIAVDPGLRTLTLRDVVISEPINGEVIRASRIEAAIPFDDLWGLLTVSRIHLSLIEVFGAEVFLDFTGSGDFNLLRAVLPVTEGDGEGETSLLLREVNLHDAKLHLHFDEFDVYLEGIEIDAFRLHIRDTLEMATAPAILGKHGLRVASGRVEFNPHLFTFPLGRFGRAEVGLGMSSGGSGAFYASHLQTSLAHTLRALVLPPYTSDLPPLRGNLVVPLRDLKVDNFWWRDMTYGFSRFTGQLSTGQVLIQQGWMNVAPTEEEIVAAAATYGHQPSAALPEDTILFGANLDMSMQPNDEVLAYFVGPQLAGAEPFRVRASLSGDLERAEGQVHLSSPQLAFGELILERTQVDGRLAGQRFDIGLATTSTSLGKVNLDGHYMIVDGDFLLNAQIGDIDPDRDFSLTRGIPTDMLTEIGWPEALRGHFFGTVQAYGRDGEMGLFLPKGLSLELDAPIPNTRVTRLALQPQEGDVPFLIWRNRVLSLPAGLHLEAGTDSLRIAPGAVLAVDALRLSPTKLSLDAHDLGPYLAVAGLPGLRTHRLNLNLGVQGTLTAPQAQLDLHLQRASFQGWSINELTVEAGLHQGRIDLSRFQVTSELGAVHARGHVTPFAANSLALRDDIPLGLNLEVNHFSLGALPVAMPPGLDLAGTVSLTASVGGSSASPLVQGQAQVSNLGVMGERLSRISTAFALRGSRASLTQLQAWHSGSEQAVLRIPEASYDLKDHRFSITTGVDALRLSDLAVIKRLDTPLDATVTLAVQVSGDADLFLGGRIDQAFAFHGDLQVDDILVESFQLGGVALRFATTEDHVLAQGTLLDLLHLDAAINRAAPLTAGMRLSFEQLDVLAALARFSGAPLDIPVEALSTSGSISACYDGATGAHATLRLEDLQAQILGTPLRSHQPIEIHFDQGRERIEVASLILDYADSHLVVSGSGTLRGDLDLEVNGELGLGLLAGMVNTIHDATGSLSLSLSAGGRLFRRGRFDLEALRVHGFIAVRHPLQVLAHGVDLPVSLSQGILRIGRGPECAPSTALCIVTDEVYPLEIQYAGQSLLIAGMASTDGQVALNVQGELDANLARLAGDVVLEASGALYADVSMRGALLDEKQQFSLDPNSLDFSGTVQVQRPLRALIRGLPEPIFLESGTIEIAPASSCFIAGGPCYLIPHDRALVGRALGGSFSISGEIWRNPFLPEGGQIDVVGNNLSYRIKDEMTLTFSPILTVWAEDLSALESIVISGFVEVSEGRYYKNYDVQSDLLQQQVVGTVIEKRKRVEQYEQSIWRRMPALGRINLDVTVLSDSGFRIDNQVAGADLLLDLGFHINLEGTLKDIEPTGIVSIRSGSVNFRGTEFEIQPGGQLTFAGSMDGRLDISAQAEISTLSSFSSTVMGSSALDRRRRIRTSEIARGSELYLLTLTLSGTVSKPVWEFDSRPYLTDANIYTLILTGKTLEELSAGRNESPAVDIAVESIIAPFFESQVDDILAADQFKFLFSEGAAQFVYVQQVNRALRIAAGVSIRGAEGNEQAISSEYRFDDRWLLELTGQNTVEEEGKAPLFRVGGRLHWKIPLD